MKRIKLNDENKVVLTTLDANKYQEAWWIIFSSLSQRLFFNLWGKSWRRLKFMRVEELNFGSRISILSILSRFMREMSVY